MKRIAATILIIAALCAVTSGCEGPDKRIYGLWADESGLSQYGFGTDGKGYVSFQGLTIPILFEMKGSKLYILFKEEGDVMSNEETEVFGITFFGDDEMVMELPIDSGSFDTYTRQSIQ